MLDSINNWLLDLQLKMRFKPKHNKVKKCIYCGKQITQKQFGFWVDGNGNTEYSHKECEEKETFKRKEMLKEICEAYMWGKEPSIERCLKCNKLERCKKIIKE